MILRYAFVALLASLAGLLGWNIVDALQQESVFVGGPRLAAEPWGWVTLLDLYLGFLVFGGYLVAREGALSRSLPWLVALLIAGNLASAAYLLWAVHRGGYDFSVLVRPAANPTRR